MPPGGLQYERIRCGLLLPVAAGLFVLACAAALYCDARHRCRATAPAAAWIEQLALTQPALRPSGTPERRPGIRPNILDGRRDPRVPFARPDNTRLFFGPPAGRRGGGR